MVFEKTKKANELYKLCDYCSALCLYHELSLDLKCACFNANMILCIKKLSNNYYTFKKSYVELVSKIDLLSDLFSESIVVSLTSYPARINTVSKAISSILEQSFKPEKILLWLASDQFPNKENDLPLDLVNLKNRGLCIEWCEDIRSYKKLLPSLKKYPNKIIVTADDDIIYGKYWLAQLLIAHIQDRSAIICHRAHQVLFDDKHNFLPYRHWPMDVKSEEPSFEYLFTGCGGVLYPPGSLHESVLDEMAFTRICPSGDDLWFWGMAVMAGTKIKIVTNSCFKLDFVPGTQDSALWRKNFSRGENDLMLSALNSNFPEILKSIQDSTVNSIKVKKLVSIIIPVYNTGEYLSACLDSIIGQNFKNIEVLCIDDGSTDEITLKILNKYSCIDSRVCVIRQLNSGPAAARNCGIKHARGEYISFVDSDDYISKNYIGGLFEIAEAYGVDIVVADKILCVDGENPPIEKRSGFNFDYIKNPKRLAAQAILTTGVSWNKIYKKSFLVRNSIRYLDGVTCQAEDNYFSILAIIFGYNKIALAKNCTYYYRQHSGGITKNINKESFEKSIFVYTEVKNRLDYLEVSDKQYWQNVVNQRALKDLRYISGNIVDIGVVDNLFVNKFLFNIDICCIADENYIIPTLVFLESIKKSKSMTSRISAFVLVPSGLKKAMALLEEVSDNNFLVKLLEIDSSQFKDLHKYSKDNNFCMASPSAMFKFIVPDIFPRLDRILYIDTDLIVRKDLLELFMTSMEDEYLCASPDLWSTVTDRDEVKKFDRYFNSGVMVMNLAKMREDNISSILINAKRNSSNFDLMDQDVFNKICNGRVKYLDIKFNFLAVCYKRHMHKFDINVINSVYESCYACIEEIANDPVVVHWAGSDKPWISTSTLFSKEWWSLFRSLDVKRAGDELRILSSSFFNVAD